MHNTFISYLTNVFWSQPLNTFLFSLLPEKKKSFPFEEDETKCGGCSVRTLEDIPDDIMEATKTLILKKEEEKEKFNVEEFQQDLNVRLRNQQNQIDRMESQLQLLVQLCSNK